MRAVRAGADPPALRAVALQPPARLGDSVVVDRALVEAAHEHGLAIHVWTINDEAEMERLCSLGADGIITDCPSVLRQVLDRRGMAWEPERSGPARTHREG